MTDEELRDKVAGLCGWTHLRVACGHLWGTAPDSDYSDLPEHWYAGCPGDTTKVPDYPRDLNAMHEAEKTLNADQFTEYHGTLVVMRNKDCMPMCRCISAPAHQRAKAFVSALNLQAERTPSLTKPGAAWSRED